MEPVPLPIISRPEAIRYFASNRRRPANLISGSPVGTRTLLEETRRSRIAYRSANRAQLDSIVARMRSLPQQFAPESTSSIVQRLPRVGERVLPVLRRPKIFSEELLPDLASRLLLDSFGKDPNFEKVKELLTNARLQSGDRSFRTDIEPVSGRLVIHGHDGRSLNALGGIAHELGHALFESTSELARDSLEFAAGSEAMAQAFEERIIEIPGFPPAHRTAWVRFQREVDALNFLFFEWEAGLRSGPWSETTSTELLLRETLFTAIGYQIVYALASVARLESNEPSRPEMIENHSVCLML